MITNSSCTLYRAIDGGFVKYKIVDCMWQERKAANVKTNGKENADNIVIYISAAAVILAPGSLIIPSSQLFPGVDTYHQNASKDIVVKGDCPFVFDNSTEQTVSDSLKQLRENYEIHTIMSVDRNFYGSIELQHIKIVSR